MTDTGQTEHAPLMSADELAEWLGVSFDLVYRLSRSGELPAMKVGGLWRYRLSDVEQYLERQLTASSRNASCGPAELSNYETEVSE